jgi:hypothetical protein
MPSLPKGNEMGTPASAAGPLCVGADSMKWDLSGAASDIVRRSYAEKE